jgi:hypothetical protein
MARRPDLENVALRLVRILGADECMLVGGLAVGAHGYVRATADVDLIVKGSLGSVRARLKRNGIQASLHRGHPAEGDFPCLKGTLAGVPFDIMPPLVSLDWQRAVRVPVGQNEALPIVDLGGLIRLKLRAQGPRDLLDVAALVRRHPEERHAARELSEAYGVADKLEVWLSDPRLEAETPAMPARRPGRKRAAPRRGKPPARSR